MNNFLDWLKENFTPQENATSGNRFRIDETRRLGEAMYKAYQEGVTDFNEVYYRYYGSRGVTIEIAKKYALELSRFSLIFRLNSPKIVWDEKMLLEDKK